jgi:hypothetical protein
MLARISEASLDHPEGAVREVVFPAAGGEQSLRDVVAEHKATQAARRARVRTVLEGSLLPPLPAAAAGSAGRAGVSVQQQQLPTGDEHDRAAGPLHRPRRSGEVL